MGVIVCLFVPPLHHFSCSPCLFVAILHPSPRGPQTFPPFPIVWLPRPPAHLSPLPSSATLHIHPNKDPVPLCLLPAVCLPIRLHVTCTQPAFLPVRPWCKINHWRASALPLSLAFGSSPAFPEMWQCVQEKTNRSVKTYDFREGYVPNYFLAGSSNFLESSCVSQWWQGLRFLNRFIKQMEGKF